MTIKTDVGGFDRASMDADNGADLRAKYDDDDSFKVTMTDADGWYFDEDACREAAEFFTKLADELKRRAS